MRIVFRTDASIRIGTGHVMRCLTLAQELRRNYHPVEIIFICRAHEGHLADLIKRKAFIVYLLQPPNERFVPHSYPDHAAWLGASQDEDAEQTYHVVKSHINEKIDWLVVDHYGIESGWHKKLRSLTQKIMVIDDLADRNLDCDLLLDQNFFCAAKTRYRSFVNTEKVLFFLGPEYALLRDEFKNISRLSYDKRLEKKRVVVFFGGMDPDNETLKALKGILPLTQSNNYHFDVILGEKNSHIKDIIHFCDSYSSAQVLVQIDNMANILDQAFLFVGSAGSITLERCFLGTPALISAVAKNQEQSAIDLAKNNIHEYAGFFQFLSSNHYADNFSQIIKDEKKLFHYHKTSKQLVNCRGMLEIVETIIKG